MHIPEAVATLERELRGVFGSRLHSLVVYGLRASAKHPHGNGHADHAPGPAALTQTLAVVDKPSAEDLRACSRHLARWHDAGLATPLLVAAHEFGRSLDAFPFEFGAILSDHVVISGADPFAGLSVDPADLRRACEVQARGHLLHLRQAYLEARGRGDALAVMIVRSAPAFSALLVSLTRLGGEATESDVAAAARMVERALQLPSPIASDIVALVDVDEISSVEAERLFPPYLEAVERLVAFVDDWAHR